jgi:hypothetical protein
MKIRSAAAVLCLLAVPAFAQDKPKEPAAPAAPAMDHAGMEAAMAAMSPGEPHKNLARRAGDWTFTSKMWMDPSQPAMESSGTMHGEMVLGGRYLEAVWKGNMMGQAFEGRGIDGYDNLSKQYVSTWIDNMATGVMYATGTCDEKGMKCTTKGDMMDPMTGKKSYMRTDMAWVDANTFKSEMYGPGPDGNEFKWMEFVVKRK